MRKLPLPSVTAVRTFSISAGLVTSTVTPGSTAPDESVTTPVTDGRIVLRIGPHGGEHDADDKTEEPREFPNAAALRIH